MFATKLTLILLGALLYLVGTLCWFFWAGPDLLTTGTTEAVIYAFAGTCAWMLITFGLAFTSSRQRGPLRAAGGSHGSS